MGRPPVNKKMTYLGVFEGFITEKVAEGTKDAVTRELFSGGTRCELQYPYWEGFITNIKYKEGKSKDGSKIIKSWNVSITDESDEKFILSIPYESRYASTLYKKVRNINFNALVKIVPYGFLSEDNKAVRGFNFYQGDGDGAKVQDHWTKDNLPAPIETKKPDGGTTWDYSAINNKLQQDFIAHIATLFGTEEDVPNSVDTEAVETGQVQEPIKAVLTPNPNPDEIMDDLPF